MYYILTILLHCVPNAYVAAAKSDRSCCRTGMMAIKDYH